MFAYYKPGQANTRQVTNGNFFFVGVLNNLRAKVAALNGAQILLITLFIRCIFVMEIGRPRFNLCI